MKLAIIVTDIAALSVILGSAVQFIPAIAGVLAVVYYGFVIYDRLKYGPELDNRTLWRKKTTVVTETTKVPEKPNETSNP